MRIRGRFLLVVLCLLVLTTNASAQNFVASLSGANEVPAADPDGSGVAQVTFVGTTVNYTINVQNITLPPVMQHIHIGGAGVNGPIVINLPGAWVGGTLVGSTTAPQATIDAILANPAGYYVNVHNTDFPGGAVRGQLESATGTIPTASTTMLVLLAAALVAGALLMLRRT